ncbi:MAG: hypothetical protein JNK41_10950 [Saprospiraceae bacterium]|jgi:hypothetical protein|nr:hypothetical protein [Saprospiraceae bacterium]
MKSKILYLVIATLLLKCVTVAQIPVEIFAGHNKATMDIMFFKYFKNEEGHQSKFLFFNRNRASIDYKMTQKTNLPQFGFTEAISYNHEKLKGFAPVLVASILNRGIYPKIGIQFAKINKDYTVFSWVVAETLNEPNVDFFFLARYTPKFTNKLNLFSQIEFVNAFPTVSQNIFSFTQRFRLGLKINEFQFGTGLDLNQSGRSEMTFTENLGGFLRYEF